MAVSHDGKLAVTTSETTNMVHWIDTGTHAIVANTLVDQRPRYAVFADDRHLGLVRDRRHGHGDRRRRAEEVVREIGFSIPGVPRELIQPVGHPAHPTTADRVRRAGPGQPGGGGRYATYTVENYLLVGRRVWHLDLTPDGSCCSPPTASPTTSR